MPLLITDCHSSEYPNNAPEKLRVITGKAAIIIASLLTDNFFNKTPNFSIKPETLFSGFDSVIYHFFSFDKSTAGAVSPAFSVPGTDPAVLTSRFQ